jgi:hypothetical protein
MSLFVPLLEFNHLTEIDNYGLLGNRYREQKLARCRKLLGMSARQNRPWKPPRIIASAMKNSPAVRSGSAQSVTKVACR